MIVAYAKLCLAIATLAPMLIVSAAEPSVQSIVSARQAGFKQMSGAFKTLKDELKSDTPNAATVLTAARAVNAAAGEQAKLFPAGSGPGAGVKTDALPAIWTERATFDADMSNLVTESGKLAALAGGSDVAAVRAQVQVTGATCGACHRQFRADT